MPSNSVWESRIRSSGASPFSQKVWLSMLRIPRGKIATYQTIARMAGNVRASRAVGNACNQNPFAPDVPCHRIVASDGSLGGYALGSAKKIALLRSEGIVVRKNKIVDFENVLFKKY
jgi:methylated-DNA-[protein]-cysteine S-methyltransferase